MSGQVDSQSAPWRLVAYNILRGGVGRADPLAEVILAQDADGVLLLEADDEMVLRRLASRLSMDFVHGGNADGSAQVAIFARSIRSSVNHALLGGDALLAAEIGRSDVGSSVDVAAAFNGTATGSPGTLITPASVIAGLPGTHVATPLRAAEPNAPPRGITPLMVSPAVAIASAWVENDRLALYASHMLPQGVSLRC